MSLDLRFFEHDDEDPLADLTALPSDKLRKAALWWLKRVRRDHSLGKELGYQVSTGDLRGLYKLYFDEDDEPWNPWDAQTQPRIESGRFAGRSNKCTPRGQGCHSPG